MAANTPGKKTSKKRNVAVESHGQAHIQATFNNIIISLTNSTGQPSLVLRRYAVLATVSSS